MSEVAARPSRRRVFARVRGFDLECPNCGAVDTVQARSGLPWWKGRSHFNCFRSRWRCRACRRVYAVGLVVWPVRRAGNVPRGGCLPPDTRPNLSQLTQLQGLYYGLVGRESVGWHQEVNLICICGADEDGKHAQDCPLADESL